MTFDPQELTPRILLPVGHSGQNKAWTIWPHPMEGVSVRGKERGGGRRDIPHTRVPVGAMKVDGSWGVFNRK